MANLGAVVAVAAIVAGCAAIVLGWALSSIMAIILLIRLLANDEPRRECAAVFARYACAVAVLSWKYEALAAPLFKLRRFTPGLLEHPAVFFCGAMLGIAPVLLLVGLFLTSVDGWGSQLTGIERRFWCLFRFRHVSS